MTRSTTQQHRTLGQRLRAARQRWQMTQEEVADEIGTSSVTISRWETDSAVPSASNQDKLCTLYHMQATDLFANPPTELQGEDLSKEGEMITVQIRAPRSALARAQAITVTIQSTAPSQEVIEQLGAEESQGSTIV